MRTMPACLLALGAIAAATTAAAGSIRYPSDIHADQVICARQVSRAENPDARSVGIVEAEALHTTCSAMDPVAVQDTIDALVAPCDSVPDGVARFAVHLLPNGRIELAAPSGDPTEGQVPTCTLRSPLHHDLRLDQACRVQVTLVEPLP